MTQELQEAGTRAVASHSRTVIMTSEATELRERQPATYIIQSTTLYDIIIAKIDLGGLGLSRSQLCAVPLQALERRQ